MQSQRAILVNDSRLLRELVKRAIEKNVGFEITRELVDIQELPSVVTETKAEWVFVILSSAEEIPEHLKVELFLKHPTLKIAGFWMDEGRVRVDWLTRVQKELTGITVDELIGFLREELNNIQAADGIAKGSE